ncbi:hypothetical protein POH93_14580 [Phytobacter diazotrophicus]|uniref:hypothetical protein n=1 Tax=Phytobacter diazotrophicus TaxID=395631 RepID=UPI00232C6F27|nr:hypothetical protein [Phytobacter diazotrophicus]MDC0726609.1 hypothetical protein [Phytobacter diazotrophicus]MDC0733836.1 hypothetical protein [Phytobacter diazotrophicus]
MNKWNQSLIWGMFLALIGPIAVSIFGLVGFYFGTLSVAGFAVLLWVLYFYCFYLLLTRPHDARYVQICVLITGILLLPWSIVLIFAYFASANAAHNLRVSQNTSPPKEG